jgi:hypothetical protein
MQAQGKNAGSLPGMKLQFKEQTIEKSHLCWTGRTLPYAGHTTGTSCRQAC